ncbi:MAG: hypothetical protein ACXU89_02695 [Xanthobacteraceae bacterium]
MLADEPELRPSVVIDWRTLAEQVDREVDAQFGEPITLTPMRTGSDYVAGQRDLTRPVVNATGVLVRVFPGTFIVRALGGHVFRAASGAHGCRS